MTSAAVIVALLGLTACASGAPSAEPVPESAREESTASIDGLWQPVAGDEAAFDEAEGPGRPVGFFEIDEAVLETILARAEAGPDPTGPGGAEITLPLPGGGYASFRIEESDVLSPELKAKYPQMRAFRGEGIDLDGAIVRIEMNATGFHAYVRSALGTIYVDPAGDGRSYALRHKPPDQ